MPHNKHPAEPQKVGRSAGLEARQSAVRYAWYGDDFTGASDTLATLASAGLEALLFVRVPNAAQWAAAGPLDAVGYAGTARALAPDAMHDELAPVAAWFGELAPQITHYKCCSTFDSAPQVGNLAVGTAALRRPDHHPLLTVIGGQPSLGRYCVFGELYASAQAGGEVHRIDRHPTMSVHPVTPMHEADLRRHLRSLGIERVGLVDIRNLEELAGSNEAGPVADDSDASSEPADALLYDATLQRHLEQIGNQLWQDATQRPRLVLGASSVAQAAIAWWPGRQRQRASGSRTGTSDDRAHGRRSAPSTAREHTTSDGTHVAAAKGPVFLLVGSLSPVTADQVRHARGRYVERTIDPSQLLGDSGALETLARDCADALAQGHSVMARTTRPALDGPPPLEVARVCGVLLQRVLSLAPAVRRVGVAGGDTSSIALRALDAWALGWAGSLANGVALTRVRSDRTGLDGLELMLKGGQMGPRDLFVRLLDGNG